MGTEIGNTVKETESGTAWTEAERERGRRLREAWRDLGRLERMMDMRVPLDRGLGAATGLLGRTADGTPVAFPAPRIDTAALERMLGERHGAMPDGESMAAHIERRYGPGAVAIIDRLLRG